MAFLPQKGGGLFTIDPNASPEQIARKRELLAAMMPKFGNARYVGEGVGQLATGIAMGRQNRQLDKIENTNRDKISGMFDSLFSGGGSGSAPIAPHTGGPITSGPINPNSPQAIGNDAMVALGKRSPYADAIASVESAGSGDYSAVGPETGKGRAYGRYQVMDFNIGPWTEKYLGKRMTPEEFLANPQAQDAVFKGEFDGYVAKYGNPQDAASMWFSGRPMSQAGNASDGYNTVPQYVDKFNAAMGGTPSVAKAGGSMDIKTLAEIAASPYASAGQKAVAQALLQQQMQAMDPRNALELQLLKKQVEDYGKPKPATPTDDMREYEYAKSQGYQGTFQDFMVEMRRAGAANQTVTVGGENNVPANDAALRKKLGEKEGEVWASYLEAGSVSAGTVQDMQLLDEIITMAPQGPISGRLAGAFPGVNSAADAFNSVVKRVAPTLRAPGSGSTSDIEYDGMLKSLPQLAARPEANRAIAAMMKAKAQINVQRAEIVRAAQNDEIGVKEARRLMSELDQKSIMTPELKAILGQLGPVQSQGGDGLSPEERKYLGLE